MSGLSSLSSPDTLDQLPASRLVKSRPWDVVGAALGAPMLLWGFLAWFGAAGDTGGGIPGFYSGPGAVGIGLVLAASALTINQMLTGRAHTAAAPPVAVLLSGAAALLVLGGLVAKPDTATIATGAIAGLVTAVAQAVALVLGWTKGSGRSVHARALQAWRDEQDAADRAAGIGPGPARPTRTNPPGAMYGGYGSASYGGGYPTGPYAGYPGAPAAGPGRYPPAGSYQQPGYPPVGGGYPQPGGYRPGPPVPGTYPYGPPPPAPSGYPPPPAPSGYPPPNSGGYPPPNPGGPR